MGKQLTTSISREEIIPTGDAFFKLLLADMAAAKKEILLETYIYHSDVIGRKVANALIRAARRGVSVKVLVDGAGTPLWGGKITQTIEKAGIETRVFHPFPWRLWQWSRSVVKIHWALKSIYLMLKINSRNHRKSCIIDNKIAYVGSMNISQCHLSRKQGGSEWRDTQARVMDKSVKEIRQAFLLAWQHKDLKERIRDTFKHVNTNPVFRLNNSWYRRRILYKNLLRRMDKSKQRIWITNAYFVPDTFLLKRLKDAAKRGVDVRVLLPQESDVMIMPWASMTFYHKLTKAGVRIFEYHASILHAKTLIIDTWCCVGSSNLNHRSLLHDLEVDLHLRSTEAKKRLEQQFLDDLANSNEVNLKDWSKRPLYQRIMGQFVLFIKYLI